MTKSCRRTTTRAWKSPVSTKELSPKSPYELNVMHITVDGKPIDDLDRSSSDVQRCTDVALDNANIQFRFDNLESRRRLGVAADPVAVVVKEPGQQLIFRSCVSGCTATIRAFLNRAEIRVFEQQSFQAEPLAIIPVDEAGLAEWHPVSAILAGAGARAQIPSSRL